ncbi:hypothetical protein AC579_10341 [Pseudocercospora musae]|uniref:Aminoglycoside phosphotransferase domain-containing protein n=1 Tax=Pseudocercospora musae TaxID=113226 RepID=A0A139ID21_9PEZI|nr:hypothetical protein AC579_10341 [Pseudocercospora musae]
MRNEEPEELTAHAVQEGVLGFFIQSDEYERDNYPSLQPCYREKEGCHHVVWAVGSFVLHALPASVANCNSMTRDRAITSFLKCYSDTAEIIATPSKHFWIGKWRCSIQQRLPGISLEVYHLKGLSLEKTCQGLVKLMRTIKAAPYEDAFNIVRYEHERPNLQKRVKKARKHWEELKAIAYVEGTSGLMQEALSDDIPERSTPYVPTLLHGDISMQHILVDEADGNITGIIDWSDAMIGDACEDIAGLALSIGSKRARKISTEVGHDDHTIARGLLFAKCLAIEDLRELKCGTEQQPPEEVLRAQFEMAFQETDITI